MYNIAYNMYMIYSHVCVRVLTLLRTRTHIQGFRFVASGRFSCEQFQRGMKAVEVILPYFSQKNAIKEKETY